MCRYGDVLISYKKINYDIGRFTFNRPKISVVNENVFTIALDIYRVVKKAIKKSEIRVFFRFFIQETNRISFYGDFYITSEHSKTIFLILTSKKGSEIREKNNHFLDLLSKIVLKKCLNHSKFLSDENNLFFEYDKYNYLLGTNEIKIELKDPKLIIDADELGDVID